MGTLVPTDLSLGSLGDDAEERVVRAFVDRLNDAWVILPHVTFTRERDFELDVVLVHRDFGVVDIEVKGHRPRIRDGQWETHGSRMEPQPFDQARRNAYGLRSLLRAKLDDHHLEVAYGVALPNATAVTGNLPEDVDPAQLILADGLDDPADALEALVGSRWRYQGTTQERVEEIVSVLCPNAEFSWDPLARAAAVRNRLDEICEQRVKALAGLDVNRRVVVTGAAGTGKTRLAAAWARRAFRREERVWLTCYNEPLALDLRGRLVDDESLRIGAFLTTALELEGMAPFEGERPDGVSLDVWWNEHAVGHLVHHWPAVTERFDTIVVDEAQDFSPAWLALLEALLDPDGPRRLLLVADERQQLYGRGFTTPRTEDGWTRAELVSNCRNSFEIATLLRRQLDGAPAPVFRPNSLGVRWHAAVGVDAVVAAVEAELVAIGPASTARSVMVVTVGSELRDTIRARLGLVPWDERGDGAVACETVHRAKGLEADVVVLACIDDDVEDRMLYIGVSRAVSELAVVAPTSVGERLGLA